MAAKTYNAGTIFLQVVPVFGDTMNAIKRKAEDANRAWGDELEKGAKESGERAGKAAGTAMAKEAGKAGAKAGDEYAGNFQEKIKASLRGAQREIDTLNFKTLSDDAEDRVKRIGKLFKELDAEITPDLDDKKLRAKLDFLRADLKKLTEGKHELAIQENLDHVVGKVEGGLKVIDKALDKRRVIEIETKISDRDLGSFEKKLRDTAKRSAKALGDTLDPALKKLKARLDALGDAEIGIDISAAQARSELVAIDRELQRLPKEIDIDLGVNSAVAHAELLAFRKVANSIDGMDVDVEVNVRGAGRAAATLGATAAAAGGLRGMLVGAFQAGSGGAENAANSFRSFNFMILSAVTLLPAMIPLIGALGGGLMALIPILGAVGAGLATMLVGFSGIGDAVGALGDVQDSAAKDSLAAGKTMSAAANGVADAERALAEARRAGAEAVADARRAVAEAHEAAAEAIEDALERQKDAQEEYKDAIKDVAEAERDLKKAREEARYELLDLDNQVEQNQIDIGQGVIEVFEAQVNYNAVMSDGSATNQERDAAALALQEAELQLKELRQEQERLAKEKAKADKKGVESTDTVQTAQEALTAALEAQQTAQENLAESAEDVADTRADAADQIADAERNLARARAAAARQVASAERNLAQAQQGLADAAVQTGEVGSAAMQKLEESMGKLGPAGRKFARFLFSLRSGFYDVRDAIQAAMLPPIQHAMEQIIGKYGPQMKGFAVSMGETIGGLFETLGNRMTKSPAWQKFFATMGRLGPDLFGNFGLTMINFMEAFASIMTAVAPSSERLSVAMVKVSEAFADWAASEAGTKRIQEFMAYAAQVGPQVVDFFVSLWEAVVAIGIALAPWGSMVLGLLTNILGFIGAMDPNMLSMIATGIVTLVIAFQAAVGIVALAYAGAAVFATTAGTVVFAVITLVGMLAALYHEYESVRTVVHAVTGFLVEHFEAITKVVGVIVAMTAAYKAYKTVAIAVRAIQYGMALATGGLATATAAQAAAAAANTKATKIGMVAMKAWTVVTNLLTMANLRLAAAFLLNPVVLITLAIIALIAVFVILFKKNETFRNLVLKVWGAIKKAAVEVWGAIQDAFWATVHAIQAAWTWLKPIFAAIGSAFVTLWTDYIRPAMSAIWGGVKAAFNFIVALWNAVLWPVIDLIGTVIWKLWKFQFKVAFEAIKLAFKVLVFAVKKYWDHYLRPVLTAFGKAVKWLWENVVKPNIPKIVAAWGKVKDAFHTAWKNFIEPALGHMKTGLQNVWEKVKTVVGWIKTAWDGMKKIFAAPIYFMLKTVVNDGIVAGFNKIANFVGSDTMSGVPQGVLDAVNPDKFASGGIYGRRKAGYAGGGVLPGYTPGQDVHHFTSPTGGRLHLSGGEAIMRPEFTSVVGAGWVDKMNMLARAEGTAGIKRVMGGQAYAKGGIVYPVPNFGGKKPYVIRSAYNLGHDGMDINHPLDGGASGQGGVVPFLSATSGTVTTGSGYGDAVFVNSPYGRLVYGHAYPGSRKKSPGSPVSPGDILGLIGTTGNSSAPHLHFGFPGGSFGAAESLLSGAAHLAGGKSAPSFPKWIMSIAKNPLGYVKGLISGPINAMKEKFGDNPFIKFAAAIPGKLVNGVKDKIWDVLPGPLKAAVKGAGVVGDVIGAGVDVVTGGGGEGGDEGFHRGGVLPYNGTMKYDSGGYLPPGLTSVVNMTGKPEPVFTADQFEGMGNGGGETFHYEPHFEGSDLTPGDIVRDMDHARRKMRREGRYARSH